MSHRISKKALRWNRLNLFWFQLITFVTPNYESLGEFQIFLSSREICLDQEHKYFSTFTSQRTKSFDDFRIIWSVLWIISRFTEFLLRNNGEKKLEAFDFVATNFLAVILIILLVQL